MKDNSATITATYRIVTQMFCAGVDQQSAELRLASFKGALRFWWRTLMAGKFGNDINRLYTAEASLFGATEPGFGQSKVRLRLRNVELAKIVSPPEIFERGSLLGTHYLGYGLMEAFASRKKGTEAGQLTRGMIPSGRFTVDCRCSREASAEQVEQMKAALVLLGTFGGLGSRSRKGFGSLTLTSLQQRGEKMDLGDSVEDRIRQIDFSNLDLSHWTAWNRESRIVVVQSPQTLRPVDLLDAIGREQVHFRSWGRDGKVLGKPSERNFPDDHDLSKGQTVRSDYPHRVAFGLPHNYGKGVSNSVVPAQHERRGSPLFMHIDQFDANDNPTAVLGFLPAEFLSEREPIKSFGRNRTLSMEESFWFPIHAYLDRLISDGTKPRERSGYDQFPDDSTWWKKQNERLDAKEIQIG